MSNWPKYAILSSCKLFTVSNLEILSTNSGVCVSAICSNLYADENITANDENTQNPVNEDANQSAENSVQDDSNTVDDGSVANTEDPFTNVNAETLQPGGITTSAESGLGVTNIINILLITVGVILILLAIAIIIRLKG